MHSAAISTTGAIMGSSGGKVREEVPQQKQTYAKYPRIGLVTFC